VDQIKSQLDALADLNDEQLSELQSTIVSEFEMVEGEEPTSETVDAMTSLADALDTVRGELSRREAQAEELAARAAEATARVKGVEETNEDGEAMADVTEEEIVPADEAPMEEAPVEEAPAEEIPAEEEATEDEAEETPAEEDEEESKKKTFSTDEAETDVASTIEEESIELSTDVTEEAIAEVEAIELSTEEAEIVEVAAEAVVEAVEASEESTLEESTEIAPEAQEEQAPVTAAAEQPFEAPADRQPVVQVFEAAPVAITAGADIPGYTAGSTINDMTEVAQAMEKRIHSLRRVNGGDGEQHIVASITTQFDDARTLTTDAEANSAKISAFSADSALVASGGHAAPLEVKYDIFGLGSTTVRPVRDSLPRFQADRGGIRFVTPPSFASGDYANAVGVWTAAVDATAIADEATKASLTVSAANELTATTDAVTLQLQFGNLMTRAYPELIARHNELALVQHAREAEEQLVSGINSGSTAVTTTNLIGFGRDFLVQVRRAAAGYRARHRLSPDARLKVVIPAWVYEAMAADLALAMPGDGTLSVSKSEIDGYLAQLNVDVVTVLDSTGTLAQSLNVFQGAGALNEFPDTFKWFLFAEGTFLFLDGGTLDLGIIRDSTLVGTNDYKMFIETFEAVAKVGIESLAITSTINVNGAAAALRDTTGGTAAATIEL